MGNKITILRDIPALAEPPDEGVEEEIDDKTSQAEQDEAATAPVLGWKEEL